MFRASSRRDGEVDDLIEEVSEEERSAASGKAKSAVAKRKDWEKDGDWWKDD